MLKKINLFFDDHQYSLALWQSFWGKKLKCYCQILLLEFLFILLKIFFKF